jgi:hypothetical protein
MILINNDDSETKKIYPRGYNILLTFIDHSDGASVIGTEMNAMFFLSADKKCLLLVSSAAIVFHKK